MNTIKSAGQHLASIILNSIKPAETVDVTELALGQGNWPNDAKYCVTVKYPDNRSLDSIWFFEDEAMMRYHTTGLMCSVVGNLTSAIVEIYDWDLGPNHTGTIVCTM